LGLESDLGRRKVRASLVERCLDEKIKNLETGMANWELNSKF
jgi:hypothetical protein